jgi:hypothetical protein
LSRQASEVEEGEMDSEMMPDPAPEPLEAASFDMEAEAPVGEGAGEEPLPMALDAAPEGQEGGEFHDEHDPTPYCSCQSNVPPDGAVFVECANGSDGPW